MIDIAVPRNAWQSVTKRRNLIAAVGVVLLLVACKDPKKPKSAAVPVAVAHVEKRDVPYEIDATGTIEPMQTVSVSAQVGGILTHIDFKEGDDVKQGQVLFQIDPRPFQAALQQARAGLAKDSAQLTTALQDEQRFAQLVQKDYVTQQQYDQAKANALSSKATVNADEALVETAQLNLEYATIRSPIAGRAGAILLKEGNLVHAGGTPLVVINQIRPIMARFAVSAIHLPRIRKYQSDTLSVVAQPASGLGAPSRGMLSFLDNAVDTTTGTIMMKARFSNTDAVLWPGEFVNVALELYVEKGAVVVPTTAVVQGQSGTAVFTVNDSGVAEQRPVQVERTAGDMSIIEKGLTPGQTVVTDGQLRITDGTKVQIQGATNGDQPRP
ncbi:MAG TPA: efflux RND transporter periplasmic adaptor subunit [Gemmatimonadaceae bacterium]|jgi:multidrug efflux system membrane fusion protein|nr:efflux RND transporter periplasmic adaptor subunit [Gemmatimonadaceae bacterium]